MGRFQELLRAADSLRLLTAIARRAACLAAVRWEEGWHRPVRQGREELGISDPADAEPYGLHAQLGPLP
ncbi:ubiquinone biosynthesis protein COQ4 [Cyanobium sp. CH-040]|uniref:ubiquinone biosynthesis protein COQ4 n=1 Tax=Cyanobium sp. CH-040 TaxID=2823708 RepID=UPI0020CFD3AC|nr:ubiquinone biosynthesis protein COQ4 [Cyanobium sp. CH-040]MCP9927518.1 hypothetical protein [Cyanobium sp. CH-040]